MNKVIIVTEANEKVATGHLMECIICAETLLDEGYFVSFWINRDADIRLKKRIPCAYNEYEKSIEEDYDSLVSEIKKVNPCMVVFNLREASGEFIVKIKQLTACRVMCIDEYGHRNLPADIIVNPMIDSYYWQYEGRNFELHCGAQYLVLPKELEVYHLKDKKIRCEVEKILITMGGVDPQNYTFLLLNEIPKQFPNTKIDIVLGGGYSRRREIYDKVECNDMLTLYENVSNLPEMMYNADLVICAGGNTLHEAACVGVPAIILPSMPHEIRTAYCFERSGFGYVVNIENMFYESLVESCEKIKDFSIRKDMSIKGKKIADGLGRKRIVEILKEQ